MVSPQMTPTEAVRRFHPYALDISSGIETDGMKDKKKMAAFAAAVRKAESLRDSSYMIKRRPSGREEQRLGKRRSRFPGRITP